MSLRTFYLYIIEFLLAVRKNKIRIESDKKANNILTLFVTNIEGFLQLNEAGGPVLGMGI
jgi:hypothetical protein